MKPTKDTLKQEIEYRISLINDVIKSMGNDEFAIIFKNEHSIHTEILELIKIFENRIGYEVFEKEKYTPIKDYLTKEPLKIGDKVKSSISDANGTLYFDDYLNQYVIRNKYNQNHKCTGFIKIIEHFDYSIDNSKVECRSHPHKKRW